MDSDERSIIDEMEKSECDHNSFIADGCEFCPLECGSERFLDLIDDFNTLSDEEKNNVRSALKVCGYKCNMCSELS